MVLHHSIILNVSESAHTMQSIVFEPFACTQQAQAKAERGYHQIKHFMTCWTNTAWVLDVFCVPQNILKCSFLVIVFDKIDKTDDTDDKLTLHKVDSMHLVQWFLADRCTNSTVILCKYALSVSTVNSTIVHRCKIWRVMQINSSPYHLGFLSCVDLVRVIIFISTSSSKHCNEPNAITILKFIECSIVDGQRKEKLISKRHKMCTYACIIVYMILLCSCDTGQFKTTNNNLLGERLV